MLHTRHARMANFRQVKSEKRMPRQRIAYALLLAVFSAILVALASPHAVHAQETPTVRTAPPQQIEPPGKTPETSSASAVDRYTLSHDRYEKAVAYSRAGYSLYFLSVFIGFVVLLSALRFAFVARIRDFAEQTTENRFLQGLIFIPAVALVLDLADLPVHMAWHRLSLRYDQSV
ncbi:MAG TPA: hypothetical protein VM781_02205, partial [Candidatus Bathyarchaeia archaeon]|nr:hypothetical protein [Candidatus Bathyarchaeia archaeon]